MSFLNYFYHFIGGDEEGIAFGFFAEFVGLFACGFGWAAVERPGEEL